MVPYTKDHVKDAPRVETDGHLEPDEEDRLYAHYEREAHTFSGTGYGTDRPKTDRDVDYAGDADLNAGTRTAGAVGRDTSGPTTDDAMTRSEERLRVGTEREAAGRVRLRKYVTTENVTKTVPVQREEVRKERIETDGLEGKRNIDDTRR